MLLAALQLPDPSMGGGKLDRWGHSSPHLYSWEPTMAVLDSPMTLLVVRASIVLCVVQPGFWSHPAPRSTADVPPRHLLQKLHPKTHE